MLESLFAEASTLHYLTLRTCCLWPAERTRRRDQDLRLHCGAILENDADPKWPGFSSSCSAPNESHSPNGYECDFRTTAAIKRPARLIRRCFLRTPRLCAAQKDAFPAEIPGRD